jgi:acyl transferase domain-containing protein
LLACAEPSGMSAAVMLSPARATAFASQAGDVVVAAVNSPSQVLLSGPAEQLRSLMARADRRGIRATPLRVGPYPQHHPGLAAAFDRYVDSVRDIRQRPPRLAVYSPVLGRRLGPEDDLVRVATLQMVRPLDFLRATTDLHEAGADRFVECGLKDTLTRLVAETLGERAQVWAPFRKRVTTDDIQRMKSTFGGANVVPEHDTLMAELRTLYASALEVPAELVTPDVDLEAEFGLDSLQHRLVVAAATERWRIRLGEDPLPATLTLRVVADMISDADARPRG